MENNIVFMDVKTKNITDNIFLMQGENNTANPYTLIILDNGIRKNLTDFTATIQLLEEQRKIEKNIELKIDNPQSGKLLLPIDKKLTEAYGNFICQICIESKSKDIRLYTGVFTINIKQNLFNKIKNQSNYINN